MVASEWRVLSFLSSSADWKKQQCKFHYVKVLSRVHQEMASKMFSDQLRVCRMEGVPYIGGRVTLVDLITWPSDSAKASSASPSSIK